MGKQKKSMDEWWDERSLPEKILLGIGFAIAGLAFVAVIGLVLRLLWNWLMPEIFGLTVITYWQSLGLLAMSWILFNRISFKDDESEKKQERRRKEALRQQMAPTPPEAPGGDANTGGVSESPGGEATPGRDVPPSGGAGNTPGVSATPGGEATRGGDAPARGDSDEQEDQR